MAESHPSSGGDSAVSIDKPYPAHPAGTSVMSTDQHQSSSDVGHGGGMEKTPTADANKGAANGKPEATTVNRVDPQAQKMGKGKIIVIMSALCVCLSSLFMLMMLILAS